MQKRIDDLENLVQKLIARSQELLPTPSPLPSDSPQPDSGSPMPEAESSHAGSSPGTTIIDGNRSVYRGAEDWYDVLQEVRNLFSRYCIAIPKSQTNSELDQQAQEYME